MVEINGSEYELKPLSWGQVQKLRKLGEPVADYTAIAWSAGILATEVEAWADSIPAGKFRAALAEVFKVSELDEGAQFQG